MAGVASRNSPAALSARFHLRRLGLPPGPPSALGARADRLHVLHMLGLNLPFNEAKTAHYRAGGTAGTSSRRAVLSRTTPCSRRLTASAALPLPGAAEGGRSAPQ
jgi:hypothetical protein